jgi:hypothetical protein
LSDWTTVGWLLVSLSPVPRLPLLSSGERSFEAGGKRMETSISCYVEAGRRRQQAHRGRRCSVHIFAILLVEFKSDAAIVDAAQSRREPTSVSLPSRPHLGRAPNRKIRRLRMLANASNVSRFRIMVLSRNACQDAAIPNRGPTSLGDVVWPEWTDWKQHDFSSRYQHERTIRNEAHLAVVC